tara:strand:+ start:1275 stop:1643 length:369 start_codon:yes stop_codon:yes gene_type:complete
MANVFCSECGAKAAYTLNKPKFCQTCGEKFEIGSTLVSAANEEESLERVPELGKLDYSIEMEGNNQITLGSLFDNPMAPSAVDKGATSIAGYKAQTKEELLSRSLAECAPRQRPVITEDGAK